MLSNRLFAVISLILVSCLTIGLVGCENKAPAKVTGTVTFDGQPLPNAIVTFVPVDGSRSSEGTTDAQGKFNLRFSASTPGAVVGEHRVEIRTVSGDYDSEVPKPKETVPKRYNDESELKQTLKSGNQVVDFALTSQE